MTVLVLNDCPVKLRGDITKWLFEINTGVYVGNINSRVREELWQRICENISNGKATMVFQASGEQHLDFWVHNTVWEPVDFDGIKLMRKPLPGSKSLSTNTNFSSAGKVQVIRNKKNVSNSSAKSENYVIVDIETTGLSIIRDSIIEIAALRIRNSERVAEFQCLVKLDKEIPNDVCMMTGITNEEIKSSGVSLKVAMETFLDFIGDDIIVAHNASFDIGFLQNACRKSNNKIFKNKSVDTLQLARKRLQGLV